MSLKTKFLIPLTTLFFVGRLAHAQAPPEDFSGFVNIIIGVLDTFVPLVVALTVIAILWAGAQAVINADDPQKLADSKRVLFWGIIVLFIMSAVWGFVNLVRSILL